MANKISGPEPKCERDLLDTAKVPEPASGVAEACAQFAAEIIRVLPMDGLSVVLLDQSGNTSRVVYSWTNPDNSSPSLEESGDDSSTTDEIKAPRLRISLNGRNGILGEVLIRARAPAALGSPVREMVDQCAEQLASALENISSRVRRDKKESINSAVRRLTQVSSSGAPPNQIFRDFGNEIKQMVEFHRLSVYLVSQESERVTCLFRTGNGVGLDRPGESANLSDSGLGEPAASGEGRIFSDLSESGNPVVWNQIMPSEMRSALLSPMLHHGAAVGMVFLEHMMPRAYGSDEQDCLRDIGAGLSAYMSELASPNDVGLNTRDASKIGFQQELAQIFGTSLLLDEIFPSFVITLAKAVPIDLAKISWLDPNGCDLLTLWASPDEGPLDTESLPEAHVNIETRISFKEQTVGVLTVYRGQGEGFSLQEQDILDRLGVQVSPVVQADRLYMFAKRQAYQLEQLKRLGMPSVSAEGLTSLAESLAGQTEDIGQAEWSAVFMRGYRSTGLPPVATAVADQATLPQHLMEEIADLAAKCFDEGTPVRRSLPRRLDTAPPNRHPAQVIRAESIQGESWNCLAMPLQNAIEKTGVLVLGRDEGHPWTSEEVSLLEEFVGEAANEVELARRQDDGRRANSGELGTQSNSLHHELLADISDSLRSPIASIKGFGSTMLESDVGWTQEMHLEFLKIIDRESDRLDQVVSDLLSPEQGEFGVAALRMETCRIDDLLRESIANYAIEATNGPVVFNCDPTLPEVLVDPSRISQVITYLLSEAREADPGNHGVTVAASWRQGKPSVSIGFAKLDGYSANFAANWQKNSLKLEICRSLLSAHGEQLEILTPRSGEDLFRFFLAPVPL